MPNALPGPRQIDATDQDLAAPGWNLKQWLINQYFFRRESWGGKHNTMFRAFTQALETFAAALGGFPVVKFKGINSRMEVMFSINTGPCRLEDLASGMQSLLSIIGDLIIHLEQAYPEFVQPLI